MIDVDGVGYLVSASPRTLARPARRRRRRRLLVETIVREDAIALYGFLDAGGARLVPHPDDGAGRRRAGRAVDPVDPVARRDRPRHRRRRQGEPQPAGRRRAQARRAYRHRAQGQGRRLRRGAGAGARDRRGGARGAARSTRTRCRRWSISAIAGSRRSAPSARVTQRLGADAPLDAVIRAGLQELAR